MALSAEVSAAIERVAEEFNDLRGDIVPLAPPGESGTGVLGGVKNPTANMVSNPDLPYSYLYSLIGIDANGVMSSTMLQAIIKAFSIFLSGMDPDGELVNDEQLIGLPGLQEEVKKMLKASLRWEQEVLVQSGTRITGYGMAPLGIHIPYAIRIKGIRYQLETSTSSGATQGNLMLNQATNLSASMNIAAAATVHNLTGLDIAVSAGSRLSLNTTAVGSGTIGKGIYMSLYGEYDPAGVTL